MGGYVALAFARKYGQRLRGLILADTRAEADNAEGKANREKMIAFAESHTPGDVLEQMLGKLVNAETLSRRPEVLQEIRAIAAAQSTSSIVEALQAMRDRPDASPFLATINVPALVIVGKDDALTPPGMAQSLAAGIKGARLEVIPGAGHLSNLEQPELFNRAVDSFLKTL
jgi:pimeloyl-ACP methyl ester carboxylesterase